MPPHDPTLPEATAQQEQRLADFIHEVGMLRHTPRSGYAFLGSGSESVAEHSHRTAIIGYILAKRAGADVARTTFLCLFHDLAEARTGDFNYVNHMYNTCAPRLALEHATQGTGLEADVLPLWDELVANISLEAQLAHDADQLDLIFNLKRESDAGNRFADQWLESALKRLRTPEAKMLGQLACTTSSARWWFDGPDPERWVRKR